MTAPAGFYVHVREVFCCGICDSEMAAEVSRPVYAVIPDVEGPSYLLVEADHGVFAEIPTDYARPCGEEKCLVDGCTRTKVCAECKREASQAVLNVLDERRVCARCFTELRYQREQEKKVEVTGE